MFKNEIHGQQGHVWLLCEIYCLPTTEAAAELGVYWMVILFCQRYSDKKLISRASTGIS